MTFVHKQLCFLKSRLDNTWRTVLSTLYAVLRSAALFWLNRHSHSQLSERGDKDFCFPGPARLRVESVLCRSIQGHLVCDLFQSNVLHFCLSVRGFSLPQLSLTLRGMVALLHWCFWDSLVSKLFGKYFLCSTRQNMPKIEMFSRWQLRVQKQVLDLHEFSSIN